MLLLVFRPFLSLGGSGRAEAKNLMLQLKDRFMKKYRVEEFKVLTSLHNIKNYQFVDIFLSNKNVINYNPNKQP